MMRAANRTVATISMAGVLALGLQGCAAKESHLDVKKLQAIIDVRIEDKFIYGHLENSIGADYQMDTFTSRVANLKRNSSYGVYGKDKNDAANAIRVLIKLGFKHLNNLGSLDDAQKATHLKVVM